MKKTYLAFVFVLALVLIPGALHLVQAQTDESLTNDELHELIVDLTERVATLEEELEDAQEKIVALETEVDELSTSESDDDDDSNQDSDDSNAYVKPTEKGNVLVCHNGRTLRVNVRSALTYKMQHRAQLGACQTTQVDTDDDEEDDDEDDDSDDEE